MATSDDELNVLAVDLLVSARDELVRHGSVCLSHVLLKGNGLRVFIADTGSDTDSMLRTLRALAPACSAVVSTFEAWVAPEHAGVRPSAHPSRVEAVVVCVQSLDGTLLLTAPFGRDDRNKPRPPSTTFVTADADFHFPYANLYTHTR
jgi:hypothetical protein